MKQLLALVALGLLAVSEAAATPRIGLFFDPEGKTCSKQIGFLESGTIWILALVDDQESIAVVGAEFGIYGVPALWAFGMECPHCYQPLFADRGVFSIVGYTEPLPTVGNIITLGWISYFAVTEVPTTTLTVAERRGHGHYATPILIQREEVAGCSGEDIFRLSIVPATGSSAVINGPCSVAVESRSWDQIKSLYR
jgi:hypothetical protein